MARVAISIQDLTADAALAIQATGTALDFTNDHVITDAFDRTKGDLIIQVQNAGNTTGNVSFIAGSDAPAERRGLGDLAISVATGTKVLIPEVESARFQQSGEDMHIDIAAGVVGTINAFRLPRGGIS